MIWYDPVVPVFNGQEKVLLSSVTAAEFATDTVVVKLTLSYVMGACTPCDCHKWLRTLVYTTAKTVMLTTACWTEKMPLLGA